MTDGGPAFPAVWYGHNGEVIGKAQPGMSLRDYFAGMIACGLEAGCEGETGVKEFGEYCYRRADAMLAERERRNGLQTTGAANG